MAIPLKVLIIEDSDSDAALNVRELERAGYKVAYEVVTTAAEMKAALHARTFDLIIADHNLPQFDALKALALLRESGLDIPFIVVFGAIGEETAVKIMKAGAQDYVMKDNLNRLGTAVQRELQDAGVRCERQRLEDALRESESKLKSIFHTVPAGIGITENRVFTELNNQLRELTGYSKEELLGKSVRLLYATEDLFTFVGDELKKQMADKGLATFETRWQRKDGKVIDVLINATKLHPDNEFATTIFAAQDITDRKRREEEQQRVTKLESLGMLAGGIAHDFNNIITGILGNISLAQTRISPESEIHEFLEQAEKASLRTKDLTQQLLTFAKGGAPVKKLTALGDMIRDTTEFVLRGSTVNCQFSIPADLWQAEVDEGQISQVISNLVINARQAMPGGGTLEVSLANIMLTSDQHLGRRLPLKPGDYIRITIADQGIGIPAQYIDKVFDPYFTTKQTGSGLGLATCYSIVRKHEGHISLESAVNAGSTFYIYLPASRQKISMDKKDHDGVQSVINGRILVMDDESLIRDVAGRMLQHIGCRDTEFATDGQEAIKRYQDALTSGKPFTAVILDLTIAGGMGGKETLKKLREIDPQVKAIASSGYAGEGVMAEFQQHGFSGVVAKPYTLAQLRATLAEVIG